MSSVLYVVLLIKLIISIARECHDYQECQGISIHDANPECFGMQSCQESVINPLGPSPIECKGIYSCMKAEQLTTKGTVTCSGYKSCSNAFVLTTFDSIHCTGDRACEKIINFQSETNIYCDGSESCQYSTIQAPEVQCNGDKPCLNTKIKANKLHCDGSKSCKNSVMNLESFLNCEGNEGCRESTVTMNSPNNEINAFGPMALAASEVNGAKTIRAYGFKSLYKALVVSKSNKNLQIELHGANAGEHANIVCQKGSKCSISCESTGCKALTVACLSGSVCSVNPCGVNQHRAESFEGTYCPTVITSDNMEDDIAIFSEIRDEFDSHLEHLGNMQEYERFLFAHHGQSSVIKSVKSESGCNGYNMCKQAIITDNTACYGYNGCLMAEITTNSNEMICGGDSSCFKAKSISSSKNIQCSGPSSCEQAKEIKTTDITCNGAAACALSNIQATNAVNCDGSESCKEAKITETAKEVTCRGFESCSAADVEAMEVHLYGTRAAINADIKAKNVWIYGNKGGYDTKIVGSSKVYGLGYLALKDAEIDSDGVNKMEVEITGYKAGVAATIICRKESKCSVYCLGGACQGVDYICYSGSKCSIKCGETFEAEETDCPVVQHVVGMDVFDGRGDIMGGGGHGGIGRKKNVKDIMLHSWPLLLLSSIMVIVLVIGIFSMIYYVVRNREPDVLDRYHSPLFLK